MFPNCQFNCTLDHCSLLMPAAVQLFQIFHRWLLILANQWQFNLIKFRICVDSSALLLLYERQYVSKGSRLNCLHVTLRWDAITSVHAFVTFDTASLNGSCVCVCVCPSFLLSLGWCTRRRSGRKSGMNCWSSPPANREYTTAPTAPTGKAWPGQCSDC